MTQITLGYSDSEDRLWMIFASDATQLWLTRRMTEVLLLRMAERMTISCPGAAMDVSLQAEVRVALEHEAAHEVEDPPKSVQESAGDAAAGNLAPGHIYRINSFNLTVSSNQVLLEALAPGFNRKLTMSRAEAHRFLAALARRTRAAEWNIPNLPHWLNGPNSGPNSGPHSGPGLNQITR